MEPARKQRLCRAIQPVPPRFEAKESYWRGFYGAVAALERDGVVDVTSAQSASPRALEQFQSKMRSNSKSSKLSSGGSGARTRVLSHLKDLKSQNFASDFELAVHLSPTASERGGLTARNRLNACLRDHANSVALVAKSAPTRASNLQISRIPIGSVATADLAYQMTTLMVTSLAPDLASHPCCNPLANGATTGRDVLRGSAHEKEFVMATTANELLESLPRFLVPRSFLQCAQRLAQAELDYSEISSVVAQTTSHVRLTCARIVETDDDGTSTWFALALISYLASDVRLHAVLEKFDITEFDLALSHALLNYARRLVGNRSREFLNKLESGDVVGAKRKLGEDASGDRLLKHATGTLEDDDDDSDDDMSIAPSSTGESTALVPSPASSLAPTVSTDVPLDLAAVASATRLLVTSELARKSRRTESDPSSSSALAEGPVGAPRVRQLLEFLLLYFYRDDGFLLHLYSDVGGLRPRPAKCSAGSF